MAWNNAESVAFMGLLSKLIQLGFQVNAEGILSPIDVLGSAPDGPTNPSKGID